jgi:hypothetical protein
MKTTPRTAARIEVGASGTTVDGREWELLEHNREDGMAVVMLDDKSLYAPYRDFHRMVTRQDPWPDALRADDYALDFGPNRFGGEHVVRVPVDALVEALRGSVNFLDPDDPQGAIDDRLSETYWTMDLWRLAGGSFAGPFEAPSASVDLRGRLTVEDGRHRLVNLIQHAHREGIDTVPVATDEPDRLLASLGHSREAATREPGTSSRKAALRPPVRNVKRLGLILHRKFEALYEAGIELQDTEESARIGQALISRAKALFDLWVYSLVREASAYLPEYAAQALDSVDPALFDPTDLLEELEHVAEDLRWQADLGEPMPLPAIARARLALRSLPGLWKMLQALPRDAKNRFDGGEGEEEVLYHATTKLSELLANGFRRDWDQSGGLGGSRSTKELEVPGVSMTGDLYVAKEIVRSFREVIGIAKGEYKEADVLRWGRDLGVTEERVRQVASGGLANREPRKRAYALYKAIMSLAHLEQETRYDARFFAVPLDSFKDIDPGEVGVLRVRVDMTDSAIDYGHAEREYRVPVRAIKGIEGVISDTRQAATRRRADHYNNLPDSDEYFEWKEKGDLPEPTHRDVIPHLEPAEEDAVYAEFKAWVRKLRAEGHITGVKEWYKGTTTPMTLPVDQLVATQEFTAGPSFSTGPGSVWPLADGRYAILDGHHRIVRAILDGATQVDVLLPDAPLAPRPNLTDDAHSEPLRATWYKSSRRVRVAADEDPVVMSPDMESPSAPAPATAPATAPSRSAPAPVRPPRAHEIAPVKLRLRPCSVREAAKYVAEKHRHHPRIQGALWALAVEDDAEQVRGVLMVGHPPRVWMGKALSVLRVATDGSANACSMLLGGASRAARAMGARSLVTYTLEGESGASLRAAGWVQAGQTEGGSWSRPSRRREAPVQGGPKLRWFAPWSEMLKDMKP